jgi:hypothetical protein
LLSGALSSVAVRNAGREKWKLRAEETLPIATRMELMRFMITLVRRSQSVESSLFDFVVDEERHGEFLIKWRFDTDQINRNVYLTKPSASCREKFCRQQ